MCNLSCVAPTVNMMKLADQLADVERYRSTCIALKPYMSMTASLPVVHHQQLKFLDIRHDKLVEACKYDHCKDVLHRASSQQSVY